MLFLSFDEALRLGDHDDVVAVRHQPRCRHEKRVDAGGELLGGNLAAGDGKSQPGDRLERLAVDFVLKDGDGHVSGR